MKAAISLIGQKFGNISIIGKVIDRSTKNHTYWECVCDCGTKLFIWGPQLRGSKNRPGQTRCKKCSNIENGKLRRDPDARVRDLFNRYMASARRRGFEFLLPISSFRELISKNCSYCGLPPSTVHRKHAQTFTYTGIDRVDNSLGYEETNTVPCCKMCNQAKMNFSKTEFLSWLKRAYEYTYGNHS